MSNLKIENGKVETTERASPKWYAIRNALEGRKSLMKDGRVKFENTQHNISLWLSVFPDATVQDVDAEVKAFEEFVIQDRQPFEFKTKPYKHQINGFEKLKDLKTISLLAAQGTGKSKLLTDIIAYKWSKGQIDAAIILSPKGVHFQWVEEQLPVHMSIPFLGWAWQKKKKEFERFENELLAFDGLQVVTANIDAIKSKEGSDLLNRFIKKHKGRVILAVDEAHSVKNAASERSKAVQELGKLCSHRAILTGTPIARNIEDLFGEYKFLDDNIIGTKYITAFRRNYCEQQPNGFGLVTVGAKNLEQLYGKIDPYTFRATKEELDLPPKVYDTRQFEMSPEQKKVYTDLKKTFMAEFEDDQRATVTNAASALIKLQQVVSGFIKLEDGSFIDLPNPRLEAMKDVLESIDGPVIIWAMFNRDIKNIMEALGDDAVSYYGATTSDQREANKLAFLSGKARYFVSNPAAGGTGLNLQGACHHTIFYTNSFNAVNRWQAEDRVHRIGTTETCTYIDLVCRGSNDNRVLANLRDKKSLSDMAIDEIRKLFSD